MARVSEGAGGTVALELLLRSQHAEVLERFETQEQLLTQLMRKPATSLGYAGAPRPQRNGDSSHPFFTGAPKLGRSVSDVHISMIGRSMSNIGDMDSTASRDQHEPPEPCAAPEGKHARAPEPPAVAFPSEGQGSKLVGRAPQRNKSDPQDAYDASGPVRQHCRAFVNGSCFEITFALLIMLNAVAIGVEVDQKAAHSMQGGASSQPSLAMQVISYAFSCAFAFELGCRLVAEGIGTFTGKDKAWNLFDLFLVVSSIGEMALEHASGGTSDAENLGSIRLIRIIRITRLVRLLRLARIVRFVRALRVLIHSIVITLKALVWAMLLLTINIYFFAIVFTQTSIQYLRGLDTEPCTLTEENCKLYELALLKHWSTLPRSMFTLFACITGGVDWDHVSRPLGHIAWFWMVLFLFFISVTCFAILNVITGVFCNSALEGANRDRELMVKQLLANKEAHIKNVKQQFEVLFASIDKSGSGNINREEFEAQLSNEVANGFLALLDIDGSEAFKLFRLLDSDGSNSIDAEEFVEGCLRLKGPAKNIDLAALRIEMATHRKGFKQDMQNVGAWLKSFSQALEAIAFEVSALSRREASPKQISSAGSGSGRPTQDSWDPELTRPDLPAPDSSVPARPPPSLRPN